MLPVVVLPRSQKIAVEFMRSALGARQESYATGVRVGRAVNLQSLPFIQVRIVRPSIETPIHDRVRVDFIVWHESEDEREQLAALVRALAVAADWDEAPSGRIKWASEFLGPVPMVDPIDGKTPVYMTTQEFFTR